MDGQREKISDLQMELALDNLRDLIRVGPLDMPFPIRSSIITRILILTCDLIVRAEDEHNVVCNLLPGEVCPPREQTMRERLKSARNAACHAFTEHRRAGGAIISWSTARGRNAWRVNGAEIGGADGDTGLLMGETVINWESDILASFRWLDGTIEQTHLTRR